MRLVEIAGHRIDPGKVTHVGPLSYDKLEETWSFNVCANGVSWWEYKYTTQAQDARESLLAAIEAADQAILDARCVSRSKHDPYDDLIKAVDAEVREAKAALDEWRARKHPRDGGTDLLQASDALDRFNDGVFIIGTETPGRKLHIAAAEGSDALVGVECGAEVRGTFQDGKFVKAMKIEDDAASDALTARIIAEDRAAGVSADVGIDAPPLSCPFDCNDGVPETVPCRLCVVTRTRAERRARC